MTPQWLQNQKSMQEQMRRNQEQLERARHQRELMEKQRHEQVKAMQDFQRRGMEYEWEKQHRKKPTYFSVTPPKPISGAIKFGGDAKKPVSFLGQPFGSTSGQGASIHQPTRFQTTAVPQSSSHKVRAILIFVVGAAITFFAGSMGWGLGWNASRNSLIALLCSVALWLLCGGLTLRLVRKSWVGE